GGMFKMSGYQNPILVASTDGVGTKMRIASLMGKFDTVGMDIVNHCVNDIFVGGADPLFFLDYIALGKMDSKVCEDLVKGMVVACKAAHCALIGGETAEMPGTYKEGDVEVAGFIVGAVEQDKIINGKNIIAGDVLVGVPSSGLHTNGYSLARKALDIDANPAVLSKRMPELGRTLGEALLEPHVSYYDMLKPLLPYIKGMAHITGGGFQDNIPRVLPKGLGAVVNTSAWEVPPLFKLIHGKSEATEHEMYRVFNMGMGMVIFTSPENSTKILDSVKGSVIIGRVEQRDGVKLD
ncbi:MAG: phosphoribosylformylglycinamidine cyclo-ligase, partial [Dehalococcoidia bacterium]|nr:phosphoribosylformylglycinamidine cyclo-ligase [Dehalococcoidia bacterium]